MAPQVDEANLIKNRDALKERLDMPIPKHHEKGVPYPEPYTPRWYLSERP